MTRRRRQQLAGARDAAGGIVLGIARAPRICGMTATPVSNPDRPSASLGKTSRAKPTASSGLPCDVEIACHQLSTATGCVKDLDDRNGQHDDVQRQIDGDDQDGDADGLLETAQEDCAQHRQQEQRDRHVLSLQPAGDNRVLDQVRRGVRRRQRHGDHEVRRGKAQQDQDEQLSAPARHEPLKHRDGALAPVALARHAPVDGQSAQQGDGDEHEGRERRNHTRGERGDRRLVSQGGEIVDAGQAHHLPPGVLFLMGCGHSARALVGALAVLQPEQQPVLQPWIDSRRTGS